ncbi:MAG: hypothetical protein P8Y20_12405 [Gammaproteobacteria bacterium]
MTIDIDPKILNKQLYDDTELFEYLKSINSLLGSKDEFKQTTAKKEQTDILGIKISYGETFYKRNINQAYVTDIKLSRVTMERLLYAFFENNHRIKKLADKLYENEIQELLNKLNQ